MLEDPPAVFFVTRQIDSIIRFIIIRSKDVPLFVSFNYFLSSEWKQIKVFFAENLVQFSNLWNKIFASIHFSLLQNIHFETKRTLEKIYPLQFSLKYSLPFTCVHVFVRVLTLIRIHVDVHACFHGHIYFHVKVQDHVHEKIEMNMIINVILNILHDGHGHENEHEHEHKHKHEYVCTKYVIMNMFMCSTGS